MKLEFSRQRFRKLLKYHMSLRFVWWEPSCSMRTDRQRDGHDEANNRFLRKRLKWILKDMGCAFVDWILLAEDTDKCRALVNPVMNF
jgi:hypothetical protein